MRAHHINKILFYQLLWFERINVRNKRVFFNLKLDKTHELSLALAELEIMGQTLNRTPTIQLQKTLILVGKRLENYPK